MDFTKRFLMALKVTSMFGISRKTRLYMALNKFRIMAL